MRRLTDYAKAGVPFAFVLDYAKNECVVEPLDKLERIRFTINKNAPFARQPLGFQPCSRDWYHDAFKQVQNQIKEGNTYLLNLTAPSKLHTSQSLQSLYHNGLAKYTVMLQDRFVSFSPETFVQINNDQIHTYPMKGTIDASVTGAKRTILHDAKEKAEHTMIVDLLRNDLGMIGHTVNVERFRYVEDIGGLLQVSSHISARVPRWWHRLGAIFDALTPAGSITGTPKRKTTQLIERIEQYHRGFFTGIFGVYDGVSVDSCVLIRYIEQTDSGLYFKSGGGITLDSRCDSEYEELCNKIYLPVHKENCLC